MGPPANIVPFLWALWLVGWLIGARGTRKSVLTESPWSQLTYSVVTSLGALLLLSPAIGLGALEEPLLSPTGWPAWLGLVLTVLGLAYTAWARIHLGRLWSSSITLKAGHHVVQTGPYAFTRHPIYTGLLAAAVGSSLVRSTVAGFAGAVLFGAGFVLKLRKEEALLIRQLGAQYTGYKASVPALVPRWPRRRPAAPPGP